jgi:hypothetical protein
MSEHKKPKFVTIKEIAGALDVSDDTVRRNPRRFFNRDKCRDPACHRPQRFFTERVEKDLRDNGHEVTF